MKPIMCLFLGLLCASLIACTPQPNDPPPVLALDIPDTLTFCAPEPAHPCPAQCARNVLPDQPPPAAAPPATLWAKVSARFKMGKALDLKPAGVPVADGTLPVPADPCPPRLCPEKLRLRWEAAMMHWGRDCKSKLGAVRGLVKEQNKALEGARF